MRKAEFYIVYVLLAIAQMLICNYFHVSPT